MQQKIFGISHYTGVGHDLTKRWFLRIKVLDFKKGEFAYRKCYGNINKYNTVDERLADMKQLAETIELTQEYKKVHGSRSFNTVGHGDQYTTVYQLRRCCKDREKTVRIGTYRKYTAEINNLERWLISAGRENLPVGAFTNNDAKAFLAWVIDRLSNASYNGHLQLFKSLFRQLIDENIVQVNPFKNIRKAAPMATPPLPYNSSQIEVLKLTMAEADVQLWLFVNFMYYTFIRPRELRYMQVGDIDFVNGKITVSPEVSKNKKHQVVSIPRQLMDIIRTADIQKYPANYFVFSVKRLPAAKPVGINYMKIRHQALLRSLKFDTVRYKLYSWKHTGAVACAKSGMPLKELQLQLRHHSLDQVNTYLASMLANESDFVKNRFPAL
jgi:integrase